MPPVRQQEGHGSTRGFGTRRTLEHEGREGTRRTRRWLALKAQAALAEYGRSVSCPRAFAEIDQQADAIPSLYDSGSKAYPLRDPVRIFSSTVSLLRDLRAPSRSSCSRTLRVLHSSWPILQRLRQMMRLDLLHPLQIGDRARQLQDPVEGPRAHAELLHGRL